MDGTKGCYYIFLYEPAYRFLFQFKTTLHETRQAYTAQLMDCDRPSKRMFVDSEYENFLMHFWRENVVQVITAECMRMMLRREMKIEPIMEKGRWDKRSLCFQIGWWSLGAGNFIKHKIDMAPFFFTSCR